MNNILKIKHDLSLAADLLILSQESDALTLLAQSADHLINAFESFSPELQSELNSVITATFAAQSRQDWLGLADYLKFEIAEVLDKVQLAQEK